MNWKNAHTELPALRRAVNGNCFKGGRPVFARASKDLREFRISGVKLKRGLVYGQEINTRKWTVICEWETRPMSGLERQPGGPLGSSCQHGISDVCMNCNVCRRCSETLDDDDVCDACRARPGDDVCDLCFSSGVNVDATTRCGKTIGIECGCAGNKPDNTCNSPACDICGKLQQIEGHESNQVSPLVGNSKSTLKALT